MGKCVDCSCKTVTRQQKCRPSIVSVPSDQNALIVSDQRASILAIQESSGLLRFMIASAAEQAGMGGP